LRIIKKLIEGRIKSYNSLLGIIIKEAEIKEN